MQHPEKVQAPGVKPGARLVAQDRVLGVIIVAVTALFWVESANISADEARMFPRAILLGLFALAGLLVVRSFRPGREGHAATIITAVPAFSFFVAASAAYVASVGSLGFFTTSALYMPVVAWLLGLRRHLMNLGVTLLFLVATYVVFVLVFARPLPREIFWG